jgi:hypothetical protein
MAVALEQAMQAFVVLRDKPYRVDVDVQNYGCNCYTKALELRPMMEESGFETRMMVCYFDWRDGPFPQAILELYDHDQETTHAWLEVRATPDEPWQSVDVTWDAPLAKLGFEIAQWDGNHSAVLAVKPIKTMTIEEATVYLNRPRDGEEDLAYREKNAAFFEAMNIWMESVRTS